MNDKLSDAQKAVFSSFEEDEEKAEKKILKIFRESLIDLKVYMAKLFENCEDDGKLTYDEMLKYGRLQKMKDTLNSITVGLYKETGKEISKTLKSAYTSGFDGMSDALKDILPKKQLFAIIRDEEINRALTNEISGLNWTERMEIHRDYAASKIRETIVKGLYEGETYMKMAKRLDDTLGNDAVNPLRIVRTESHRVFAGAKKDRLDKITGVIKMKTWITSEDEKVRANHKNIMIKTIPYDEDFILPNGNKGFAPCLIGSAEDDINCRCDYIIDFKF